MLLEFTIGNFLSIKNRITLNLVPTSIQEFADTNIYDDGKCKVLKSAAIYGANASGKSNILKAFSFIKWFVVNSSKDTQTNEKIEVTPFKLCEDKRTNQSYFELVFCVDDSVYRYGFEVNSEMVISEWLFKVLSKSEKLLFIRQKDNIEVSKTNFKEGIGLEEKTRNNALFLSVNAQFNSKISKKILSWFYGLNVIDGLTDTLYEGITIEMMKNDENYSIGIKRLIKEADMNILDLEHEELEFNKENLPKIFSNNLKEQLIKEFGKAKLRKISTKHNTYDSNNNKVGSINFNMEKEESEGTKKYFRLAGPIFETLQLGKILVIDELDAKLHPLLTKAIVKLFNSKISNSKGAQIIFATHDTNLLSTNTLRRDEIWFTEKDQGESTDLYSLADYKIDDNNKVRNDASYEKDYIKGKYGAIPFPGDFYSIFIPNGKEKKI